MPSALRTSDDGSLVIGPQGAILDDDIEATANLIRGAFNTRQGEWVFDLTIGIAWRDFVLGTTDEATIAGYLAEELNAIAGVASVDPSNITVTVDPNTRQARIEIKLIFGARTTDLTFDTSLSEVFLAAA